MFIKVTQSGNRRYAQLVESFRNEQGKPRQRTVCTLGGSVALVASGRKELFDWTADQAARL